MALLLARLRVMASPILRKGGDRGARGTRLPAAGTVTWPHSGRRVRLIHNPAGQNRRLHIESGRPDADRPGLRRRHEMMALVLGPARAGGLIEGKVQDAGVLLDTSVIIDGRIMDIAQTGFLRDRILVPHFVLAELQYIADSSDALRRNRGRPGLEVLNMLQKEPLVTIDFIDEDVPELTEVDMKLIKLAKKRNAAVMTNDYNLNRVAQLEGVRILNLNNLANALKPVVIPGEEMNVQVIKEGKEQNQGVAYLDDGTMIVVENGRRYINQTIGVIVTSVLQTAAGRMIFATPASESTMGRPKPLRRIQGGGGTG